jgi:lipopolysaccharide transport system permease protein
MLTEKAQQINIIVPQRSFFHLNFKEIWRYRDLLTLFIRREIVVKYKQTILGPLWYFIQPLLQTLMFTIVFGNIAGIPTDGVPKVLFYLAGVTAWNYFAESLKLSSDTFIKNYQLFNKIYFPRAVLPIAIVSSNILKFIIQLILFLGVYFYFILNNASITPNLTLFLIPIYIFMTAGLSLGFGLLISALTAKYRDLNFLIQFGVQLWMYATPIIYPISEISERNQIYVLLNPMTSVVEAFKYAFLGAGKFSISGLTYSFIFMIIILLFGIIAFNRMEKNFVDTA